MPVATFAGRPMLSGGTVRLSGPMEQQQPQVAPAAPVMVHRDERAITEQATLRMMSFLRGELEQTPDWHPHWHECSQQLRRLQRRLPTGPRAIR